jgi:predicted ATP-dependent endonuclease of OLD family
VWIKKIHIENYKSLKEVDIELNEGVNVFIGKNNTGKSNIVNALMFLSKAVRTKDISDQYKEIVFGKDIKNEIKFDLEFTVLDAEWKDVFVKLQLGPDISFDVFKEYISNKIGYAAKFGGHDRSFYLLEEEVCIYFKGERVVFAKSFWNDEGAGFERQIIENLKERINTNTWDLVFCGGGSPPDSILYCSHTPIRPEENLLISLFNFIESFKNLNPIRSSPESMEVYGGLELKSDGSNLPRVLNTIASSNRELFATIIRDIRTIIEDISEINAPLIERSSITFLSTTEKYFGDIRFGWDHISAGTKEIIHLVTFLRTVPSKSLIFIEEPELHLHAGAIINFLSLLESISSEDDKQILLNTHSFMLIELAHYENLFIVTKDNGATNVRGFSNLNDEEKKLMKSGVMRNWFMLLPHKNLTWTDLHTHDFLLVLEGKHDESVWKEFIKKESDVSSKKIKIIEGKGENNAIKIAVFLKLLKDFGIHPPPFLLVLDSDNKKEDKETRLEKEGLEISEFYVLDEKETESYLVDAEAISRVVATPKEDVKKVIDETRGRGKEKLKDILKKFGFDDDAGIKQSIAANMDKIPEDILSIIKKIKTKI